MASWKKVLVSGSSIEVAAITASVVPTGTSEDIVLIGSGGEIKKITQASFQGSIGQYSFTASADTGTDSPVASTQILEIKGGDGIITNVSNAGGTTFITASVVVGNGISIVSDAVTVNTSSAHFTSGVSKEVFDTANFVDSSEVNFTVTTGTSVTAALINGSIANARLANSSITIGTTNIALGATSTSLAGLASLFSANITGSAISASGALTGGTVTSAGNISTTTGNITTVGGYIQAGNPAGAPNTPGSVQAESFWTNGAIAGASLDTTGNVIIGGDLTVNGTTTTINTTELLIEDKFALFASGSTVATDGGIIVQASAGAGTATGYAYGYEATADRWVYQDALAYNATGFGTPTAYAVSAEFAASGPPASPSYGGASFGYGNIHVNTSTGEIFIYS